MVLLQAGVGAARAVKRKRVDPWRCTCGKVYVRGNDCAAAAKHRQSCSTFNSPDDADSKQADNSDDDESEHMEVTSDAEDNEDTSDEGYAEGYMALVRIQIDETEVGWALVHDIAETQDEKLQGTLFSSVRNRRTSAYFKHIPRDLETWTFVERLRDETDNKEFNGTPENQQKYPSHAPVVCVLDKEKDILFEGFALEDGCIPLTVIAKFKKIWRSTV